MKKLIVLLLATATVLSVEAQKRRDRDDVVYLENGSIIRGTLVEQTDETVKLQTYDGNVFVWELSAVGRLDNEPTIYKKRRNQLMPSTYRGRYNPSRKGYMGIVEGYVGVGRDIGSGGRRIDGSINYGFGSLAYGVNVINGYRFGHHFAMGFGTGIRAYSYSEFEGDMGYMAWEYSLPMYGHFRADFFKTDITPFVALNVGYNAPFSPGAGGRYAAFFTEPSFGVAFRVSDRNSLSLSMGCVFIIPRAADGDNSADRVLSPHGYLNVGFMF